MHASKFQPQFPLNKQIFFFSFLFFNFRFTSARGNFKDGKVNPRARLMDFALLIIYSPKALVCSSKREIRINQILNPLSFGAGVQILRTEKDVSYLTPPRSRYAPQTKPLTARKIPSPPAHYLNIFSLVCTHRSSRFYSTFQTFVYVTYNIHTYIYIYMFIYYCHDDSYL